MKKIISLILSVLFCAVVFASCSGKEEPADTDAQMKVTYDAAYSDYDESVISGYKNLCSSFVRREESVRMNSAVTEQVLRLYDTSFPLHVMADAAESSDGSGITLTYRYNEESHTQYIKAFNDKVDEIVQQCYAGTLNKTVYALNAYRYVCEHYVEAETSEVYDVVTNGFGDQYANAGLFEYLLRQADIPAYHVIAISSVSGSVALSAAILDGSLYYFDITAEAMTSRGATLRFFGMTTADLEATGISNMFYTNGSPAENATDLRFDTCRESLSWKIEGTALLVTVNADTVVSIDL